MVDVGHLDLRVPDYLPDGGSATVEQVSRHLLEFGPSEPDVQVQFSLVRDSDERQVDSRPAAARQLDLGLLGGLAQPLQRRLVLGQVDAVAGLEVSAEPVEDPLVPVVSAQVVVSAGSVDVYNAFGYF